MPAPKPRRGNRGQVRRDEVARKQRAQQAERGPRPERVGRAAAAAKAGTPTSGATPRTLSKSAGLRGDGGGRRGLGGEQVEGRRAVRELLVARRRRVRDVWVAEGVEANALLAEIEGLCEEHRVAFRRVPRARIDAEARTDAPQGVLAHADPLPEVDLETLVRRRRSAGADQPKPFLLALDGITDPHNLGALLRSAECSGATGVVLPRHRSAHVTPTVAKAAAGAVEYLPMAVAPGLPAALSLLKEHGVWTVGLAEDGQTSLFDLEVATEPVALVLGAEGTGLSRLVRQRCDVVVSIPQHGRIDSLNVSAAGALACFEVARRRQGEAARHPRNV
ncbi:MAG: rRNA (guanosine2251-2-O)-methyltransferase [Acidimicrobiaceae bacterium]|nr:rRNA (guanosine2251-2-O)-methyltransferase [Acidimicrobiaceae bacterium]